MITWARFRFQTQRYRSIRIQTGFIRVQREVVIPNCRMKIEKAEVVLAVFIIFTFLDGGPLSGLGKKAILQTVFSTDFRTFFTHGWGWEN